jgi:PadR family transcriptional regulator PadR
MRVWLAQMRKGLVEPCVLAALRDGEAYGYQILQRLGSAESLGISESTVYPVLARLAADGLVRVREAPSPAGPPRRYYRITWLGEARLAEMTASWRQVASVVNDLLKEKPKNG